MALRLKYTRPRVRFFETNIENHENDEINSKNVEAQKLYYRSKKYQEAILCLDQTIELDPLCSILFYNRALCYLNLNDMENAYLDAKKSVELNPISNDKSMKLFMQIAVESNKINDALCVIEELGFAEELQFLKDLKQLEERIKKAEELNQPERILCYLMLCLERYSGCKKYLLEKAEALILDDQSEKVESILSIDLNGETRQINYIRGLLYLYRDNDIDNALKCFDLIVSENEFHQDNLYLKAKIKCQLIAAVKGMNDEEKKTCENSSLHLKNEKKRYLEGQQRAEEYLDREMYKQAEDEYEWMAEMESIYNVKDALLKESNKNIYYKDISLKIVYFSILLLMLFIISLVTYNRYQYQFN